MSTKITLIDLPTEILLIVLKEYFSQSFVSIAWDKEDDTSQNNIQDGPTQFPKTLSILLVNKALHQLGTECFHKYANINSNSITHPGPDPSFKQPYLSNIFHQVPWQRLRYISYGGTNEYVLKTHYAFKQDLLPFRHLREINVLLSNFGVNCDYVNRIRYWICSIKSHVKICEGANTVPKVFVNVGLFGFPPGDLPPGVTFDDVKVEVAQLKFVVRSEPSIEMCEVEVFDVEFYMRYKEKVEQAWNLELPTFDSSVTRDKVWQSDVVRWPNLWAS